MTRSVVTCSVLAVLGKTEELKVHLGRAVDNGVTVDELRGLIVQVAMYAGCDDPPGPVACGEDGSQADGPVADYEQGPDGCTHV